MVLRPTPGDEAGALPLRRGQRAEEREHLIATTAEGRERRPIDCGAYSAAVAMTSPLVLASDDTSRHAS